MKEEEAFLEENWESQPLVVRANQERKDLFPALSSLGFLKNLLKSRTPFQVFQVFQMVKKWPCEEWLYISLPCCKDLTGPSIST